MPMASASLVAYCSELASHHNPTQFGTSVPGGCWSSPQQASADESSDSIPIFRVEHRMNSNGMIFTPGQSTLSNHTMVVGSLGSDVDSEVGSWCAQSPSLRLFDDSRAPFMTQAAAAMKGPPGEFSPEKAVADIVLGGEEPQSPPSSQTVSENQSMDESGMTSSGAMSPSSQCPVEHSMSSTDTMDPADPSSGSAQALRPRWVNDEEQLECSNAACGKRFGMITRRHHCRACGNIFCAACSSHSIAVPLLGYHTPVRVCDRCVNIVKQPLSASF